ncbi:MAG: signal peptidase I [Deltaproteobacteria bacterium]|nr:signal peptidase I [Deltaproteobacteria bacterium]
MVKPNFSHFNYNGPSMNPTLKAGDGLRVVPYENTRISVGDVVVFHTPETNGHVSHRVISVDDRGLRTRGDNNNDTDSWILRPNQITGRVISARRGPKSLPILGGKRGMLYARSLWLMKRADPAISRIFHPVYHRLAVSGIFRRVLPRGSEPRILRFTRHNGVEMQVLMGRWIIGRRKPGEQWLVRRPFRFFVDKASLPD